MLGFSTMRARANLRRCTLDKIRLFAFANKFAGASVVSSDVLSRDGSTTHSAMAPDLPNIAPNVELEFCVGDAIAHITKYYGPDRTISAIELTTKLGDAVQCGTLTHDRVCEDVPPGKVVSGLVLKFKGNVIKDVVLSLHAAPSIEELGLHLARLYVANANANPALKSDDLLESLRVAVNSVKSMHSRGVVVAAPLVSTLIELCDIAYKQFRPRHRRLVKTRAHRKLALVCVDEDLDKVFALMQRYQATEAKALERPSTLIEGGHMTLREFAAQTMTSSNIASFVRLHTKHPAFFYDNGTTDKLITYAIQVGDVTQLNEIATVYAKHQDVSLPVAMAHFAARVPAIRIAIASAQLSSLCWLLAVARLEPISPPAVPSPVELHGLPASPLALAEAINADPEVKTAIIMILRRVDRRRQFLTLWLALAKRTDEPVTRHELLQLVREITRVQDLPQIQALATALSPSDQECVFLAAAKHVIHHKLVLYNGALWLFLSQLDNALEGRLIAPRQHAKLQWKAKKVNVGSAPCIKKLTDTLGAMQLQVQSLESHASSLQQEFSSLREWAIGTQRGMLHAATRQRYVALVTTLLSAFGGPLFHAIGSCINISDANQVLSTLAGPVATQIYTSLVEESAATAFDKAITQAVSTLAGDSRACTEELLRVAPSEAPPRSLSIDLFRKRNVPLRLRLQLILRRVRMIVALRYP